MKPTFSEPFLPDPVYPIESKEGLWKAKWPRALRAIRGHLLNGRTGHPPKGHKHILMSFSVQADFSSTGISGPSCRNNHWGNFPVSLSANSGQEHGTSALPTA